jgi:uncharacterized protein YutE (UPF0331/DUF86 family)
VVDPGRLRSLLDRIGAESQHLTRLAGLDTGELIADSDRMAAVKYRFIVAIEAAIDCCHHVIASEGLRAAVDFADAFTVLGEAGLLPAEILPRLQDMARFRNLLVHGYAHVDDRRVAEILHTRLGDLQAFRIALAQAAQDL